MAERIQRYGPDRNEIQNMVSEDDGDYVSYEALAQLARDVLKVVQHLPPRDLRSTVDYRTTIIDALAALRSLFRSQGIEIDQKEGETDGL